MLSQRHPRCLQQLFQSSQLPPTFLAPVLGKSFVRRFTRSTARQSHIGSSPLTIPREVEFKINEVSKVSKWTGSKVTERSAQVTGPLGTLSLAIPHYMDLDYDESRRQLKVAVEDKTERKQREMWGTTRAYLSNYILGVSEGHTAILRLVGVGYRATIENSATTVQSEYPGQQFVSLKLGYAHPVELGVPIGVKASAPQPTRILLEGADKEVVNKFAAEIRRWRRPEPYKGKGIFVNGETIKLKSKKIK